MGDDGMMETRLLKKYLFCLKIKLKKKLIIF